MRKKKWYYVSAVLAVALLLLMLQNGDRRQPAIQLPQEIEESASSAVTPGNPVLSTRSIGITPETVQDAIRILSRPVTYRRTETVTLYSDNDTIVTTYQVAVSGGTTRIDSTISDGTVIHRLFAGRTMHIWYDDDIAWHTVSASNADALHQMPTYESVLSLPVSEIVLADFVEYDGRSCISVTTAPTVTGYQDTYWIDTATGLLCGAERTRDTVLVYRFSATEISIENIDPTLFLLPDGTTPTDD